MVSICWMREQRLLAGLSFVQWRANTTNMKEVALGLISLYGVFDVVAIAAMLLILWGDPSNTRVRKYSAAYTLFLPVTGPLTLAAMIGWSIFRVMKGMVALWRIAFIRPPA